MASFLSMLGRQLNQSFSRGSAPRLNTNFGGFRPLQHSLSTTDNIHVASGAIRGVAKVFGYPPEPVTKRYSGVHCHPGMVFGYKRPIKRQGKVKRLPNVRLKSTDYEVCSGRDGSFNLMPPWPPRVNRTIEVTPPWGGKINPWPTHEHKKYPMRWKNIEYEYTPRLMRKPHGHSSQRWSGPVTRIEHHAGNRKTKTMVTHDYRLLN